MQNFQILRRIWKHVNGAKHWIAIAIKTVTGQYGSSTVLLQQCYSLIQQLYIISATVRKETQGNELESGFPLS